MDILIGFQKHNKDIDDIYILPTLAVSKYHSANGKGYGIGVKFLKVIFMLGVVFRPIAQQPLSGSADATPKLPTATSDSGKRCATFQV